MSAGVVPASIPVPAATTMPAFAAVPAAGLVPATAVVRAATFVPATAAVPAAKPPSATTVSAPKPASTATVAATAFVLRLGWTNHRDRQSRRDCDQQVRPLGLALHWLRPSQVTHAIVNVDTMSLNVNNVLNQYSEKGDKVNLL
jgi:hypothetical protein